MKRTGVQGMGARLSKSTKKGRVSGQTDLEYASSCVIPTTPKGFTLLEKRDYNHDSTEPFEAVKVAECIPYEDSDSIDYEDPVWSSDEFEWKKEAVDA